MFFGGKKMLGVSRKSPGPFDEVFEHLLDDKLGFFVDEISFVVKFIRTVRDHDLRFVYRVHVQKDHYLPQVILHTRGADATDRSSHDGGRFAIPRVVAVGPRRPIDDVLKNPGTE